MNTLMLVLRIVHISAGIVWGGGSVIMHFFFGPTVKATNQTGQQFAGHLMLKSQFVTVMTTMATLTVLAGASLYWLDTGGLTSGWMKSNTGIGFAIGGLFGFVAFVSGVIFGHMNKKLAFLGSQVQGKPSPEQLAEIQSIQQKIALASRFHTPSIIIAILFMSASRYFLF